MNRSLIHFLLQSAVQYATEKQTETGPQLDDDAVDRRCRCSYCVIKACAKGCWKQDNYSLDTTYLRIASYGPNQEWDRASLENPWAKS